MGVQALALAHSGKKLQNRTLLKQESNRTRIPLKKKNLVSAMNVVKLLVTAQLLFATREHILEKNPTSAMNVKKPSAGAKTS